MSQNAAILQVDNWGRPVYIELMGRLNITQLLKASSAFTCLVLP
jgi:hypothetical protein